MCKSYIDYTNTVSIPMWLMQYEFKRYDAVIGALNIKAAR